MKTCFAKLSGALKLGVAAAAITLFAGCQSKNPMDYLPQASGGYVGINMDKMRSSDGLKRLSDEIEALQAGATDMGSEKATKIYIAFDEPSGKSAPNMYGVATGMPGFADDVVKKYKENGASAGKTSGRDTYTSGGTTISPVGSTGILFFNNSSMLDKMVAVSKKKEVGARASSEFTAVDSQLSDHAVAGAVKAAPLLTLATPFLGQLEMMNPAGVAAIKKISMISMNFNWDKQPVIEVKFSLPGKQDSDALAAFANQGLAMAKLNPALAQNPDAQQIVSGLEAKSAEDGVTLTIEVPEATAEKLFGQLEKAKAMQAQGAAPFAGAPNGMMPAAPTPSE